MNLTSERKTFGAIEFQVLWARLVTIVDEVAITLENTAFSSVVRDNRDYACGLYDASGDMLVQATTSTTGQVGAMTSVMHDFLGEYPVDSLSPGDVLITNDPWIGCGHTPDIYIATPIFLEGSVVGFSTNSAHHIDIGGRLASPDAREVYEEGIIIPMCKLYDGGSANETIFKILTRNVRMSDKVIGDLRAQIAANHVGAKRVLEMMRERGLGTLTDLSAQILDQSEQSMRAAITEVPDGTYEHTAELDESDTAGNPIVIKARVDVAGDEITVDFSGTSPQVEYPINCVYNITFSFVMFAIKCALRPHIPNNVGCYRPIHFHAPEGSILNARFPAAVMWRTDVCYYITEAIFGALSQVIPGRVKASSGTYPLWLTIFAGQSEDGQPFVAHFNASGGQGARHELDGPSTTVFPGNIQNTPIELLESDTPLLCEKKALVPNSGGAGRYRGGNSQEVVIRNLGNEVVVGSVVGGRYHNGPVGFAGGQRGFRGEVQVNDDPPFERSRGVSLAKGDRLRLRLPGGGGFGDPRGRDVQAAIDDVRQGLVSRAKIETDYGLELESQGPESGKHED